MQKYCTSCGTQLEESNKFCTKCGYSAMPISQKETTKNLDEKWWHRLVKVAYIILYIPLPFVLLIVWNLNNSSYVGYYLRQPQYKDTYGKAFWYSLLALIIYVVVVRLIKITFLYITFGQKVQWKKEFKKLF